MALEDDSISLEELVRRLNNDNGEKDHIDKLALIFGTEGDGLSHHTILRRPDGSRFARATEWTGS